MANSIVVVLLIVLLVYVIGGFTLYHWQRKFIYSPTPYSAVDHVQEVKFTSGSYRLHGYIANPGKRKSVLYFGGNAEAVGPGLAELAVHLPEVTLIGFDYRGYGGSEGTPSEAAFYADALNIFDNFSEDYEHISVLGRSLGSGVATYVATERPVHKLILVTPFDSIVNLAAKQYWYYPVRWLLQDRFDSLSRAPQITVPTLVLVAETDDIVPHRNTERLVSALANCPTKVFHLKDTSHNSMGSSPLYTSHIRAFLNNE